MFTVATLNIHNQHHRWRERRELIITEILELMPDILALQEVNIAAGQGWWLCRRLNRRLGRRHYEIRQQRRLKLWGGRRNGVAILTHLPILSEDVVGLGFDGCVALRLNLAMPAGYTLDVVSTQWHDAPTQPEARHQQAMRLVSWLNGRGEATHQVIAGDLGEAPHGKGVHYLQQQYRSAYAVTHGRNPIATRPTALIQPFNQPTACLDYIFVSSTTAVENTELIATRPHPQDNTLYPSDHIGLLTTLSLRPIQTLRVT